MNDDHLDRLVASKLTAKHGALYDFDGKNCEDCPGWDGKSKRCECGNRRVSWVLGFDGKSIYGEAD